MFIRVVPTYYKKTVYFFILYNTVEVKEVLHIDLIYLYCSMIAIVALINPFVISIIF